MKIKIEHKCVKHIKSITVKMSESKKKQRPKVVITDSEEKTQNVSESETESNKELIINRGTGAGGANTNLNGKKFENKTDNTNRLIEQGYTKESLTGKEEKGKTNKNNYYLIKKDEDKTTYFATQHAFKKVINKLFNIQINRNPDEGYIIEYKTGRKVIKILEKKEQNGAGSVDTKLWAGPGMKREYELVMGPEFEIVYGFCINSFLQNNIITQTGNYKHLPIILSENNIEILYGDDNTYFETLDNWLISF